MDFFSTTKGRLNQKTKAKVVPIPAAAEAGAAVKSPEHTYGNLLAPTHVPHTRYKHGFSANRNISNTNKAALIARRHEIIQKAAMKYGPVGVVGATRTNRPKLIIPSNNVGANKGNRRTAAAPLVARAPSRRQQTRRQQTRRRRA